MDRNIFYGKVFRLKNPVADAVCNDNRCIAESAECFGKCDRTERSIRFRVSGHVKTGREQNGPSWE